ncbi:MAG: MMPL family transporter, partial [Dehalococcoidia bacterium]
STLEMQAEEIVDEDFSRIMMVTLVLGLGILLITFRAVVAAIIPLLLAVVAIFSAIGFATLVSHLYPMEEVYTEMILLMGLAVGIDYSLFIISRFRNERKAGRDKVDAISVASNTTGRAVFYAGITVVLSLVGLTLTDNPVFISLALGAIIVVLIAIVGSLTLLPALLSVLGDNINRLQVPFPGRGSNGGGIWGAISDRVLARPAALATVTAVVLIALAVPVTTLNLGFNSGADAYPDGLEGKRALELLEEHFSSGRTEPAIVVVDAPYVNSPDVQLALANLMGLARESGSFSEPFETEVNNAGDLLFVRMPIVGNVDDDQSEEAVNLLRQEIIPEAFSSSTAQVYVTGQTAGSMDFRDHMYDSAPYVFGFVLGLAFLLLLIMFRSIVIPLKAIVLNLLSVGAAYGVLVMVFQWGWGVGLLGSEASDAIEAWLPLFLFGILFGLSMDYHMLLLNRIKEYYDQGHANEEAVSLGIKATAGQITSAAAIMVGVFSAFALSRVVGLQQFGLGLGVAVLIDATVIRTVLLPASMKLLGDWNWYLPSWLSWLPKVGPDEGTPVEVPSAGEPEEILPSQQSVPAMVPIIIDE